MSAISDMRALHDHVLARLEQNEDFRALNALRKVLRELNGLPAAASFPPISNNAVVNTALSQALDLNALNSMRASAPAGVEHKASENGKEAAPEYDLGMSLEDKNVA